MTQTKQRAKKPLTQKELRAIEYARDKVQRQQHARHILNQAVEQASDVLCDERLKDYPAIRRAMALALLQREVEHASQFDAEVLS